MDILLFENFSKRKNSTKRPDDASGTADNVVLKDAASIVSPTFILARTDSKWNYIKWAGRYYYVDDIVRNNAKMSEYRCSLDVLATFRTNIRESSAYIVRSAYTTDRTKQDPLVSIFNGYANRSTDSEDFVLYSTDYSYVLTIDGTSGKCVYVMSLLKYLELIQWIFQSSDFVSLFEYIKRIVRVPIAVKDLQQEEAEIVIGLQPTGIRAGISFAPVQRLNNVLLGYYELNKAYNDWRDYDGRISTLSILICGQLINIDPYYMAYSLSYDFTYDPLTSTAYVIIKSNNTIIAHFNVTYGCDIQLSAVTPNFGSIINNSLQSAAGLMESQSDKLSIIADPSFLNSALSAYVSAAHPPTTIAGSTASNASMYTFAKIWWSYTQHLTALPQNIGYPTYEHRKLNVSGYIQTLDANVECDFIPNVSDQINSALDSGVYME